MAKIVTSKNIRPTQEQRVTAALAKKPTASHLNKKGLTPEQASRMFGNGNGNKQQVRIITKMGGIKRKFDKRPSSVLRKPGLNVAIPACNQIPVPDWFKNLNQVDVSIIVPMFRSRSVIEEQIKSWDLNTDDGLTKEIIYVDDACPDKSHQQILKTWEACRDKVNHPIGKILLNGFNSGFSNACNAGARYALGKYLIFLNADTTVTAGWIKPMIDLLKSDNKIGLVGNLQVKNGKVDSAGSEWSWRTRAFEHIGRNVYNHQHLNEPMLVSEMPEDLKVPGERDMVTGCCMAMSKRLFESVDGFDINYRIGYWEDSDINMKVRSLGYKIFYQPQSIIHHLGGHSKAGGHEMVNANRALFNRKWVDTKLLEVFIDRKYGDSGLKVHSKDVVVYTAINKQYDALKDQPKNATESVDFVAFLDSEEKSTIWSHRPIHSEFTDSNRNAKIHKVLPHKYFPDKQYSLWIDGSVQIIFPYSIERLIEVYLASTDLAIFRHPDRNCIFEEANACIQRRLDDPGVIKKQIERYTKEGYPANLGLVEATILLRRHSPNMNKFNEAWWEEIEKGSRRDQISFNYVARKMNLKYTYFPGHLRMPNYLFKRHFHNNSTR